MDPEVAGEEEEAERGPEADQDEEAPASPEAGQERAIDIVRGQTRPSRRQAKESPDHGSSFRLSTAPSHG